jgi:8-hydroxy-5-deazaflavin:NADPH oxidoreductase
VSDLDDSVAIVGGTGALGFALAARLAAAGVQVVVGSRAENRASDAAVRLAAPVPGERRVTRVLGVWQGSEIDH